MIAEEKNQLRKKTITLRRRVNPVARIEQSAKIAAKLFALPEYLAAKTVGFFASKVDEIDTDGMILRALEEKKRVVLPRVVGNELDWHRVTDLDHLTIGQFAVREPRASYPKINLNRIDFLVVPSVALDRNRNRLGYGKGYYDRVLEKFRGFSVAIGFSCQLLDKVPRDRLDKKVSKVIVP